jgi:tRNA threonylcarbamoyladenosine biosynthesis protein TsaB
MLTLCLDASTAEGTVALLRDGAVVAASVAAMRGENSERLMPTVVEMLRAQDATASDISAVACGAGPGGFTSLRIAAAIAKGFAAARSLPLFVAPSPLLIVSGAEPPLPPGTYLALLDAMRGDVFSLVVTVDASGELAYTDDAVERRADAETRAESLGAVVIGPPADGRRAPHARGFARLFQQGLVTRVELATWEPNYGRKAEAQVRWERTHGTTLETL